MRKFQRILVAGWLPTGGGMPGGLGALPGMIPEPAGANDVTTSPVDVPARSVPVFFEIAFGILGNFAMYCRVSKLGGAPRSESAMIQGCTAGGRR